MLSEDCNISMLAVAGEGLCMGKSGEVWVLNCPPVDIRIWGTRRDKRLWMRGFHISKLRQKMDYIQTAASPYLEWTDLGRTQSG